MSECTIRLVDLFTQLSVSVRLIYILQRVYDIIVV